MINHPRFFTCANDLAVDSASACDSAAGAVHNRASDILLPRFIQQSQTTIAKPRAGRLARRPRRAVYVRSAEDNGGRRADADNNDEWTRPDAPCNCNPMQRRQLWNGIPPPTLYRSGARPNVSVEVFISSVIRNLAFELCRRRRGNARNAERNFLREMTSRRIGEFSKLHERSRIIRQERRKKFRNSSARDQLPSVLSSVSRVSSVSMVGDYFQELRLSRDTDLILDHSVLNVSVSEIELKTLHSTEQFFLYLPQIELKTLRSTEQFFPYLPQIESNALHSAE